MILAGVYLTPATKNAGDAMILAGDAMNVAGEFTVSKI